jgi:hypothetical protein
MMFLFDILTNNRIHIGPIVIYMPLYHSTTDIQKEPRGVVISHIRLGIRTNLGYDFRNNATNNQV